jgi:hypothetical protein
MTPRTLTRCGLALLLAWPVASEAIAPARSADTILVQSKGRKDDAIATFSKLNEDFLSDSLGVYLPEPKEYTRISGLDFAAAAASAKEHAQKANEQNSLRLARLFAMRAQVRYELATELPLVQ